MKNKLSQINNTDFETIACKNLIKEFIQICTTNKNSQYVAILKREKLDLYNHILHNYPTSTPAESLYQYLYNKAPLCIHCNQTHTKFISYNKGYASYCSKHCGDSSTLAKEKRKNTNLKKYGSCCPLQSSDVKKISQKTCMKKYGVSHFSKTKEFKEKLTSTMKERYGCEYAMQSEELKEKYADTLEKNHGVRHPSKSKAIYKNRNSAMKEKHGCEHAMQSEKLKEKYHQTLRENHGVDFPLQSREIHNKFKETMKSRYGKEYTAEVNWLFEQMKLTNLERYGVEYPIQNDEIKEQMKLTNLERYGVEYPIQNDEIKKSIRVKMEQESKWIPKSLLTEMQLYYKQVIKVTNKQPLHLLENFDKRGLAGTPNAFHVDHKISIKYGFENNIPPYIIGNINNLEMLPWYDNVYKSSKCSMDLCDLFSMIF